MTYMKINSLCFIQPWISNETVETATKAMPEVPIGDAIPPATKMMDSELPSIFMY